MSYILIVQDAVEFAEQCVRALRRWGYQAYAVENSAEALDLLHESTHLPALILLDVCTPRMDGVTFRRQQKASPRLADILVIAFSSYSNILRCGAQHLFDGYLAIPCELEDLRPIAERYCQPTAQ